MILVDANLPIYAHVAAARVLRSSVSMIDMLGPGRQILASQPFSMLLGAELLDLAEGRAEFRIPIRAELKQQYGFVHGGVISSAADNALTYAGGTVLGTAVVTAGFTIDFLRPATGDFLIARAAVVHRGRNQAVCRCDVFVSEDGAERLCATAQGTIARLQPNRPRSPSADGAPTE